MSKLLHRIQIEGNKYGLKLNQNKCELIQMYTNEKVYFMNGDEAKPTTEAKYVAFVVNPPTTSWLSVI